MGGIQKLGYSHEAMIDQMIANPAISGRELARLFGVTEAWLSQIKSSNAFRERMAQRRAELVDPLLKAELDEKFSMMAHLSADRIIKELSKPEEEVPVEVAMQAAAFGAKALGVGGFGAKVSVNVAPADPNRLDRIADRLRSLNQPQGVVDVQVREVPDAR
jgi:hypothetical protein